MGVGGIILAQLSAGLIEGVGWRSAITIVAIVIWAVMLPATLLIRSRPEDMGLLPDGHQDNSPIEQQHPVGEETRGHDATVLRKGSAREPLPARA